MDRLFYAVNNAYADETSIGFSNTWQVLVFDSRAERDAYVRVRKNLAVRAIKKSEVTRYVNGRPNTSKGERYAVMLDPYSGARWVGVACPGDVGFERDFHLRRAWS